MFFIEGRNYKKTAILLKHKSSLGASSAVTEKAEEIAISEEQVAVQQTAGGNDEFDLSDITAEPKEMSREDIIAAAEAAAFAEDFKNRSFLDPAVKGEFPVSLLEVLRQDGVLWQAQPEELAVIRRNTVDFLGVNYYQPFRAKAKESPFDGTRGWMPEKYFDVYEMPSRRMNPYRGWEIYPQAMYDIAINIRDNYGNIPWYISENGMGVEGEEKFMTADGYIEDDYRIDFYKEHLGWLHKGIEAGSNCFGFHAWTPIDCWSWSNAYKNRYGYIAVDLATQKKTIKKSGYWIKSVIEHNGF